MVDEELLLDEPLLIETEGVRITGTGVLRLRSRSGACAPVLHIRARDVVIGHGLTIELLPAEDGAGASLCPALLAESAPGLSVVGARVIGGARVSGNDAVIAWSDISNPVAANNGTCVQVVSCGNATTLTPCNVTVHDNFVHDCRADGGSPYAPQAQGVLLGGADAAAQCTVGVVVRNNNLTGIDEMGIRVNNDNHCPSVLNVVELNKIEHWGQLNKTAGGDTTDSGCLYVYGHWYGPGNILRYNFCISSNASEGQNGVYLDDASTGQVVVGNVFLGATAGSALKVNGGSFHVIDSNLAIAGISLGFANCRGLRGDPSNYYTCANEQLWMSILESANYLQEPWRSAFPFYSGWCTNTTAGPFNTPCAPTGAPAAYECAILSRGNSVSNLAGVQMTRNGTFELQTLPGFPIGTGACPTFVETGQFNAFHNESINFFFGDDQFVDAAGGDYTLRDDSDVYRAMPSFVRVPFRAIGIGGSGDEHKPTVLPALLR